MWIPKRGASSQIHVPLTTETWSLRCKCLFVFINCNTCLSAYWKTVSVLPQLNQYGQMHWLAKNCCMLRIQRGPLPCLLIQWVIYSATVLQCATILSRLSISILWKWISNELHIPTPFKILNPRPHWFMVFKPDKRFPETVVQCGVRTLLKQEQIYWIFGDCFSAADLMHWLAF